jgi:hypothetical protein
VVAAALQHLGNESLYPAAAPGSGGVKEDELWPPVRFECRIGLRLWEGCHALLVPVVPVFNTCW